MAYQLGRILKFNQKEWAFVSFEKGSLTVYSLPTKEKARFRLTKAKFDGLYSVSSGEISQEVVDLVLAEEAKRKEMIKSLKTGMKFIGSDDGEYYFLNLARTKLTFYDKTGEKYTAKVGFIKDVTNEIDEDYLNHLDVVTTKKEYNALTDKEKVHVALNYLKSSYGSEGTEFEILELGNVISGVAYYHEVDDFYDLIGLQIKFKYKFDFQDEFSTDVGFFPIYIGKIADYYPVSFEESYSNMDFNEHTYYNGCGDKIEVDKILISKEIVNSLV